MRDQLPPELDLVPLIPDCGLDPQIYHFGSFVVCLGAIEFPL
jgi:hypothetical protein